MSEILDISDEIDSCVTANSSDLTGSFDLALDPTKVGSVISGYSGDVESVGEDSSSSDETASIDSVNCPSPTNCTLRNTHPAEIPMQNDARGVAQPIEASQQEVGVNRGEQGQEAAAEQGIGHETELIIVEVGNLRRKRTEPDCTTTKRKRN